MNFIFNFILNFYKKFKRTAPCFAAFVISAFVLSCNNVFDTHKNDNSSLHYDGEGYLLQGEAVLPDNIQNQDVRMAVPVVPESIFTDTANYRYKVYLDGTLMDDVTLDNGNFALQLHSGTNNIKVEVESKFSFMGIVSWILTLTSSKTVNIGPASPKVLSESFSLEKVKDGDSNNRNIGYIDLTMSVPDTITYATHTLLSTDPAAIESWANQIYSGRITSDCKWSGGNIVLNPAYIGSGTYKVRFDFYDNSTDKNLLYSTIETIEIFNGLTTNRWKEFSLNNSAKPTPIQSSGSFVLTEEILEDFANTSIYVDPVNGLDNNGGTYYGKFKTLQKAVDTAVLRNGVKSGTEEFNIYLCGDISSQESVTLDCSAKAMKLNIKSDSTSRRTISGKSQSSALLRIKGKSKTDTIISLNNIELKGQNNTTSNSTADLQGGAIYVNNTKLNLTKCSINSNDAKKGAGIYCDTGASIFTDTETSIASNNKSTGISLTGRMGGGIYAAGDVTVRCSISGNAASSGGGVYVDTTGKLLMYDSGIIGDSGTGTTDSSYSNSADYGGGVYNIGIVALGYETYVSEGSTSNSTKSLTGGICHNIANVSKDNNGGGGIYNYDGGTVSINSGNISYNKANSSGGAICTWGPIYINGGTFSSNKAINGRGGAFFISNNKKDYKMTAGKVENNSAKEGGGAFINLHKFIVSGGTFSGNTADTAGGAIYNNGTLELSKTANLYTTSNKEKTNDVYLAKDASDVLKYVSIGSNGLSGSDYVATITPALWDRGKTILSSSTYNSRFVLSDTEWKVVANSNVGKIDADLYVAENKISTASGYVTGDDANGRGTKKMPYKTIAKAASQCWNPSADGYTIYIAGTITSDQSILSTGTYAVSKSSNAKKITLQGYSGTSNNKIQNPSGTSKRCLTITTDIPITISGLEITGGKISDNGGGIYVSAAGAQLTLADGAKVDVNEATGKYGGGVYFAGTSDSTGILTMSGTSVIAGNIAAFGGGIYVENADMFMYGKALVGDTSGSNAATTSSKSNYATTSGGGICCNGSKANLYLGYSSVSKSENLDSSYGIRHNYSSSSGGGIINYSGIVSMASGSVVNNSGTLGGGVYMGSGTKFFLSGSAIVGTSSAATSDTKCSNLSRTDSGVGAGGGGVYCKEGSLYIGYSHSSTITAVNTSGGVCGNYANKDGAGIYFESSDKTQEFKVGAGNVSYNKAVGSGGGIYVDIDKDTNAKATMTGGSVLSNSAKFGGGVYNAKHLVVNSSIGQSNYYNTVSGTGSNGGAIYNAGTVYFGTSTNIPYGGNESTNSVYLSSSTTIGVSGNGSPSSTIATVIPSSYSSSTRIMSSTPAQQLSARVNVVPQSDGTQWFIEKNGLLKTGALVTASDAASVVSTLSKGGTLKINNVPSADQFYAIRDAIVTLSKNNSDTRIEIDLSDVSNLTSIPDYAFWPSIDSSTNCTAISSIKLPTSVQSVGKNAFAYCQNLTSITGYTQVTSLGEAAFEFCSNLASFTIPTGLTSKKVPANLLYQCGKITSISIPDNFTEIGDWAFSITGLTSISIPPSVTKIGNGAFNYCKFSTLVIPDSVTSLGESFASNCLNLTSVTFSNKITAIPKDAFYTASANSSNTKLSSITIPSWITSIGYGAFQGCTALTSVTFEDTSKTWKAGTLNYSVTSPAANATNLKDNWNYEWTKN